MTDIPNTYVHLDWRDHVLEHGLSPAAVIAAGRSALELGLASPTPRDPTMELAAAVRALSTVVQQQAAAAPEWLDAPAAVKHLGLPSLRAVYQMVRCGDLPAHKLGRRLRFARAELDALIQSGRLSRCTTGRS